MNKGATSIKTFVVAIIMLLAKTTAMAQTKDICIRVIQTSDVHGCFFPYDFIDRKPEKGSMARISSYVKRLRKDYGDILILLDNGDILQGQPTCYYCNYVKPNEPNVAASVINYMGYDAETVGNHDIETGHAVYDKWASEVKCPMLGANVIDTSTGKPYFKPYQMFVRDGVRIAVLGMLTPAIPNWLNEKLWKGMRFEDIATSCKKWIAYLKSNEKSDIIIGLFHSGWNGGITTPDYEEDATLHVAEQIDGFDLILYGHDHRANAKTVKNSAGNDVLCLDPSSNAYFVCDAEINLTTTNGKVVKKSVTGKLHNISDELIDEDFIRHFQNNIDSINAFVNRKIGVFTEPMYTRDSYFGSSSFCDFIHNLQLKLTGADVSFNAPLSFDACINAGDVHVSDMFNLYRYENQIYALTMTGKEIRNYLEMSYDLWVNTMESPSDHIMLLSEYTKADKQRYGFKNLAFNFDSAAGIDYEVDVTKPNGQKVRILRMSDGRPFREDTIYKVAMNSYRGNGGGELLTKGAGIPIDSIKNRIVWESERDQRYYLTNEIETLKTVTPKANQNWRFVPEVWAKPAIERDKELLFNAH